MGEEEKQEERIITKPVKYPGRVAQGHKLAALMKKRKEEMRQQEGTVEPAVKSSSGTSSVQSMDNVYLYGVGTLAVLAIAVGVWYKFGRGGKNGGETHKPTPEPQKGKAHPEFFKML